jgi:hypothetical protein
MEAMRVRPKLALIMRHASGTLWARMDWDRARWGCMTREPEPSHSAGPTVIRLGEEDWRTCRFYERQGFRATGHSRPFPGDAERSISEMILDLL